MNIVKNEYGIIKLKAKTTGNNIKSRVILDKLGFIFKEIKMNAIEINGKKQDFVYYYEL